MPTPIPRTSCAPARSRARSGPTTTSRSATQLLSEFREYERGTTASVNAAVQPILDRYVRRLQGELEAQGFKRDLLVMNGNGGTVAARLVAREAAKTIMSGPASGVMAAAATLAQSGVANAITYDMGGTSTDVALIHGGVPQVSAEITIDYGLPIHVPMVDVQQRRRRRRLDRLDQCGGHAAGRAAVGGLRAGPHLLRPRRHRADHHRRQPGARPARSRAACSPVSRPVTVDAGARDLRARSSPSRWASTSMRRRRP